MFPVFTKFTSGHATKKNDSNTAEVKYKAILDKLEQLCFRRNKDKVKLDKILDNNAKL